MRKKAKFPYDYLSVPLTSVSGSATFTGNPSSELLEAVNKMAELAFSKLKNKKGMTTKQQKLEAAKSVVAGSLLHGWNVDAKVDYIKAVLPDHYKVKESKQRVMLIVNLRLV